MTNRDYDRYNDRGMRYAGDDGDRGQNMWEYTARNEGGERRHREPERTYRRYDRDEYGYNSPDRELYRDDRDYDMNREMGRHRAARPNSYDRGLGGLGAYNPDRRVPSRDGEGRRGYLNDRYADEGMIWDRELPHVDGTATSVYSDRDMGNLSREPYGMGNAARGRDQGYGRQVYRADERELSGPSRREGAWSRERDADDRLRWESGGERAYGVGWDERGRDWSNERMQGSRMVISAGSAPGPHVGRGPRGYRRSDQRIQEDVNEELTYHHELDATDIEVRSENGEVTLSGTVSDRWQKRLAEDVAERVRGVKDVHNRIRVQGRQEASVMSTTAMSGGDSTNLTTIGTTTSSNPGATVTNNSRDNNS